MSRRIFLQTQRNGKFSREARKVFLVFLPWAMKYKRHTKIFPGARNPFLNPFLTISLRILGGVSKSGFLAFYVANKNFFYRKLVQKSKFWLVQALIKCLKYSDLNFYGHTTKTKKNFRTQSFESENPPKPLFLDVFGGKSP